MRKKLTALLIGALLLTGCSGVTAPTPTVTVVQTAAPTAATQEQPAAGALALGDTQAFEGFSFTVHGVNLDPAPAPAPQPQRAEDRWVSADIEYCSDTDTSISTHWWRLVASDNRQYQASSTGYDAFPQPPYAWGEVPITAGTCHRGWITFVAGREATLTEVRYAHDNGNAAGWAIP